MTDAPEPPLRAALADLPVYRAGRSAVTGSSAYKLSSNENPCPPLPGVLQAVADASASMPRYPDFAATKLVQRLSEFLDVDAGKIAVSTGSVALVQSLRQVVAVPGDEVVFAWRSFEAYPIFAGLLGVTAVPVALTVDERHHLDAMARAVTPRTRLIFLCTPNNPTGPAVRRAELEEFLSRVPRDVLVVLDEAYVEYVREPEAPDGLSLLRGDPRLVSLRTFSKAYGLAGLRVGYAVAATPVAEALRKAAVPFGVNTLAQVAAVASLDRHDEVLTRVRSVVAERDRVLATLRSMGWTVPDPQGNFVWLRLGNSTERFAGACETAGVVVRAFPGEGVRVTVGEQEANDIFLAAARAWRQAVPHRPAGP